VIDDVSAGYEGDDSGAAPAGPADPSTPQQGTPDDAQASDAAPSPAGQVPKGFIPQYRLREVTERNRQLAARVDYFERQQQMAQQQPAPRPAAPAGPDDPESEVIRQQFFKLFPWAKNFQAALDANPDLIDRLQDTVKVVPQFQSQMDQQWQAAGASALRMLSAKGGELYGGDMNPSVQRAHELAFIDRIERDPELRQRYLQGDHDALVREYWQEMTTHMYDPIRRRAAVTNQQRAVRVARVPSSGPASQALGKGAPKPKTEEDVHEAAAQAYFQGRP
jgi:hypothetical protein